ncbi:MAG: DUF3141 domain-containing protein [Thermodesulfobacteriota bacterium]
MDAGQRSLLFWDVLRQRGNNYREHVRKGQPPVLTFDYETIIDGRTLERPVNYDLARIIPGEKDKVDPRKRPVVVIDPRAGHGPGIGGSKRDSEIGRALDDGHPVYFVLFHPEPCPGQTIADVETAEVRFIEEVRRRHPDSEEPAVIGNCQAGWAVALLGADRPDVTGPLVLNGSPLSYWSGVEGRNPMRYVGGLLGGVWLSTLTSDLGNGKFDGAHLVANFEALNPANSLWTKLYNLYAHVDTEEKRFLDFEKWWGGFFLMTAQEMHFITENLFVGDRLEQGRVQLDGGRQIDLKNLEDPLVLFASSGDNITPPQQALNWIAKVYGSVEEIKRQGQVIVYLLHKDIGHLGIFVSGKVAQKEHKEIIGTLEMLDYLEPGLYEMIIEEKDPLHGITDYNVRFAQRDISDILALDDGLEDELNFETVAAVSEHFDRVYNKYLAPWFRALSNEFTADLIRQAHYLRSQRYMVSDLNPWLWPVKHLAPLVKKNRRPVKEDNLFWKLQQNMSDNMVEWLDFYRDVRDQYVEDAFKAVYSSPWLKALFPGRRRAAPDPAAQAAEQKAREEEEQADRARWLAAADQGGFMEGLVRIMLAAANADHVLDRREFLAAEAAVREHPAFHQIEPEAFKEMVKDQARILQTDEDRALAALRMLLPRPEDRAAALEIAERIVRADEELSPEEAVVLARIKEVLERP